jgi:hypothetical protein
VRLAKAGYGPEAAGLCRSLVEAAINSQYIAKDSETRSWQFLRSVNEQNDLLARRIKFHHDSPDFQAVFHQLDKIAVQSGWPKSLAERAYAVQKPSYAYDVVFNLLSQQVHASAAALAGQIRLDSPINMTIRVGRGAEWVDTALVIVFMFLTPIMNVAYEAFELDKSKMHELSGEFERFFEKQNSTVPG